MPANTSPDNIEYPVSTDPVAPLETVFANMANSIQDGFDGFRTDWNGFESNHAIQTFRWADATARAAQTGMVAGDVGFQINTSMPYRYNGSSWVAMGSGVVCVLGKSASQSLTTSLAPVSWNVEISDTFQIHDNSVNNTRMTAPIAGVYEVTVFVYNNNTTGTGVVQARKNGTTDIQGSFTRRTATTDAAIPLDKTFPVVLAAGDYIEIMASHSAVAGTVGGGSTAGSSTVTMKWIG